MPNLGLNFNSRAPNGAQSSAESQVGLINPHQIRGGNKHKRMCLCWSLRNRHNFKYKTMSFIAIDLHLLYVIHSRIKYEHMSLNSLLAAILVYKFEKALCGETNTSGHLSYFNQGSPLEWPRNKVIYHPLVRKACWWVFGQIRSRQRA